MSWRDERYRSGRSPAPAVTDAGTNERAGVPAVQASGLVPAPCVFLDCPARHPVIRCRAGGIKHPGLSVTTTATSGISLRYPPVQRPLEDRFSPSGRAAHQMRPVPGCAGSRGRPLVTVSDDTAASLGTINKSLCYMEQCGHEQTVASRVPDRDERQRRPGSWSVRIADVGGSGLTVTDGLGRDTSRRSVAAVGPRARDLERVSVRTTKAVHDDRRQCREVRVGALPTGSP